MVMSDNRIDDYSKYREIAGHFDDHAHVDAAVCRRAHRSMEHIQGFTWSHWMPPSSECLRPTTPAAAMSNQFVETTLYMNKTQLLPSNYSTFLIARVVVCDNFVPQRALSQGFIEINKLSM
jgi:hypothetical protein